MYHILSDNIPLDDIGKMFNSHSIFTNVDIEVMSCTPSEYLKNRFVLQTLWCLKLSVWIIICDVLENTKFKSSVGNQLRDGKLFQICIKHVIAYNFMHMYVCMCKYSYTCIQTHVTMYAHVQN